MVKDLRERRKPPVQARSRETVAIILEATGKIIAQRGIKSLSMREVGRVAGVSSGTLYQYFKSSTSLLASWEEAMFQRSAADFTAAFAQMMAEPESPRWEVAIYRMVRVGLDILAAHAWSYRRDDLIDFLSRREERLAINRRVAEIVERVLAGATEQERLRFSDLAVNARLLVSVTVHLGFEMAVTEEPETFAVRADEVARLLVHGLVKDAVLPPA